MKFPSLNLLIISLSILHIVLAEVEEDIPDCELALDWKDIGTGCCNSDSGPYFCNADNRIVSIKFNSEKNSSFPQFRNIPKFEYLTLLQIEGYEGASDIVYSIHINIFKEPKLKTLIVDAQRANSIATDIDPNCSLEELTLKNTRINNFPKALFKLNNLKKIELANNTLMNVKIVKFKNSPIQCNLENSNVDCYQEGACSNISSNNYRKCTDDEIYEILGKEEIDSDKNSSKSNNSNSNGILIASIIGICIIVLLSLVIIVIKYNKKRKNIDNSSDIEIYERRNQFNPADIDLNQDFPIVDNSNYVDDSVPPSYDQLEYSHSTAPLTNIDSKSLLKV